MTSFARCLAGLALLATPALAEGPGTGQDYAPSGSPGGARPDTRALTCADAAALVARAGAVVMTTGAMTYERIVRDGGFCTIELTARPAFEATRDVRMCFVGYRCVERMQEGRDGP
ncbi:MULTISPECIES: hypothetical protein [unclassified Methylobacterium]|uniref:hypothetical protein n=1 Tax=unclassified Methylobacterium TaxID=2615210 RepID=UPI00165046E0|nr:MULTISPECIES: hypothetical protein [unclassified Methylobacterium]